MKHWAGIGLGVMLAGCAVSGGQERVMTLSPAQVSYKEPPPVTEVRSGERMILIQPSQPTVTRLAPAAAVPPPLEKTRWRLSGAVLAAAPVPGEEPYIRIANGVLDGFSGCNRFNGSYQRQSNGMIRFNQIRISSLKCPGLEIQERGLLRGLMQARRWTIAQPDILRLQNDPGQVVVEFRGMAGMP